MCGITANITISRCCPSMTAATPVSAAPLAPRFRSIPTIRAPGDGRARNWNAESTFRHEHAMEFLLGFAIAVLIGLMGVGGGVITAPVLTLFFGVPPAEAVGTALIFTAIVKLTAAPIYLFRKQVNFRV